MIRQKPISLKIDTELLGDLDAEVALGWRKRNSHINEAVRFYLDYLDTRRQVKALGLTDAGNEVKEEFIRKWFPEWTTW